LQDSFHPYQLADEEDGKTSYVFYSTNGAVYAVSFDASGYDKYLNEYPNLFKSGYALSIFQVTNPISKITKDPLVFNTIENIIEEFAKRLGNDIVLLYHCDYNDGRQSQRDKLFRDKFEKSLVKDRFTISRYELYIPETDTKHYMGYITSVDNPNIKMVELEFDACSFNLLQDNVK
jgi:Family of unknown function (DUF6169)